MAESILREKVNNFMLIAELVDYELTREDIINSLNKEEIFEMLDFINEKLKDEFQKYFIAYTKISPVISEYTKEHLIAKEYQIQFDMYSRLRKDADHKTSFESVVLKFSELHKLYKDISEIFETHYEFTESEGNVYTYK